MAGPMKCAHPACNCTVEPKGPFGKYCSDHCKQAGDKIELRGFGSFRIRQRESRKGRNPKTGERVDVPAKKVPYFKPGKELKELINTSEEMGLAPAEE